MDQNKQIKDKLYHLAEPEYQQFTSRLLPGIPNILGIRLPALRKLAKELAKESWKDYLENASDDSFEEIMLQGMTIGYIKTDLPQILLQITAFIPKINNWSTCDSFCSGLKIAKTNPKEMWDYILPTLSSEQEYTVRFGVVMLLYYYIDENHIEQMLTLLDAIKHPGYYAKMAVAWAVSMCYVAFPDKTLLYLKNNTLDDETYHKALQKITESLKVNKKTKHMIRTLKRTT